MTQTIFGYLILIGRDFYDLLSGFLLSFISFDWEGLSNTQDSDKWIKMANFELGNEMGKGE